MHSMSDLISNDFAANINTGIIKRSMQLINTAFILSMIYFVIIALEYYIVYKSSNPPAAEKYDYILFIIRPIIILSITVMNILAFYFSKKANKLIKNSFDKNDPDLFNDGYPLFVKAGYLSVITF